MTHHLSEESPSAKSLNRSLGVEQSLLAPSSPSHEAEHGSKALETRAAVAGGAGAAAITQVAAPDAFSPAQAAFCSVLPAGAGAGAALFAARFMLQDCGVRGSNHADATELGDMPTQLTQLEQRRTSAGVTRQG